MLYVFNNAVKALCCTKASSYGGGGNITQP